MMNKSIIMSYTRLSWILHKPNRGFFGYTTWAQVATWQLDDVCKAFASNTKLDIHSHHRGTYDGQQSCQRRFK